MKGELAKSALRFVLIIGVVNLLADFTYEGGRAVVGPFLGSLGASAAVIGFTAGFGEFVGYALRSISGYFADKTHRYWPFAFAGYALNQLAIPALALVTNWQMGSALVIAERTGRAIRKPAMDAMLSHAGQSIGAGWVFGLNEALDQAGATAGPLLIAYILASHGTYRMGFGFSSCPQFSASPRLWWRVFFIRARTNSKRNPPKFCRLHIWLGHLMGTRGRCACRGGPGRFLAYQFSFSKKQHDRAKHGSDFLRCCHGHRGDQRIVLRIVVRQVWSYHCSARFLFVCRFRAARIFRRCTARTRRHDFVGNRDGR